MYDVQDGGEPQNVYEQSRVPVSIPVVLFHVRSYMLYMDILVQSWQAEHQELHQWRCFARYDGSLNEEGWTCNTRVIISNQSDSLPMGDSLGGNLPNGTILHGLLAD